MFSFSEYYSYSQRCLVVQNIILIPREGRVRSLHTLYTLCDTLSPHPPLVIMMMLIIMMMMMMILITYYDEDEGHDSLNELLNGLEVS